MKIASIHLQISIFEVVGGPLCVASSDGQKVYDRLTAALKTDLRVTLSFQRLKYSLITLSEADISSWGRLRF